MKTSLLTLLIVLGAAKSWSTELQCENKLQVLEQQGIHRGAFLQALKNARSDENPSRYVVMANLKRGGHGSELHIVDTHTGRVEHIPFQHGVPENAGDVLNYKIQDLAFFGGSVMVSGKDGIDLQASSPSLKKRLSSANLGSGISLQKCPLPASQEGKARPYCVSAADLKRLQDLMGTEKNNRMRVFSYPERNLETYLKQHKLANDEPNVCKVLGQWSLNSSSGSQSSPPTGRGGTQ